MESVAAWSPETVDPGKPTGTPLYIDKSSGDHQASRDNGGHRKSGPRGDERPPSAGCVSAERGMHGIVTSKSFGSDGIEWRGAND